MVNIISGSGHLLWLPKQNGLTLSLDGSHQSELRVVRILSTYIDLNRQVKMKINRDCLTQRTSPVIKQNTLAQSVNRMVGCEKKS